MHSRPLSAIIQERDPVIVTAQTSIYEVARILAETAQGVAVVISDNRPAGLITRGDIVERVVALGLDPKTTTAGSVMTENPVVIKAHCSVGNALFLMHEYGVHYIPVVDESGPVCVIHVSDAIASDLSEYAHDALMLDRIAEIL